MSFVWRRRSRGLWLLAPLAGFALTACAVQPDVVAKVATQSEKPAAETSAPTASVPPTTPSQTTPATSGDTAIAAQDVLSGGNTETEIYGAVDYSSELRVDSDRKPRPEDEMVAVSLADIKRWWSEQYPLVFGGEFVPLEGGVFPGSPESTVEMPSCENPGETMDYETLQELTAFYCPEGDFIAFDDAPWENNILTSLSDEYGPAVFAVMLAHEYGHAIQQRSGVFDQEVADIYTEQQADCYSGAWVAQSYNGNSPLLRLGDKDIRTSLLAMLELRDPVGTNQLDAGGHGAAFDRVGAFEEGFLKGPARCAELINDPLQLIPNAFFVTGGVEEYQGGNAPYDCADLSRDDMIAAGFDPADVDVIIRECVAGPILIPEDLNSFWKTNLGNGFPALKAEATDNLDSFQCTDSVRLNQFVLLCPSQQTVAYGSDVVDLYREFGDFTLGYLMGLAWGEQAQLYMRSTLVGEPRALANDCLVGAWARDVTPLPDGSLAHTRDADGDGEPDAFVSSPGDLDEATRTAILTGDLASTDDMTGTAFDKIAALRRGALGGYSDCAAHIPTK